MGKYDNLMNEDVFEVFGEENVNKALEVCTRSYDREDFVKKLKKHDRYSTAVLVLTLLRRKIIVDKELKDYYNNDLGEELSTGRYLPCC